MAEVAVEVRWDIRLRSDRDRAMRNQSGEQRAVTAKLVRRAIQAGASAVALTGSTARAQRTAISDLDYHVVGARLDLDGLPGDVDVVADSLERFQRRLADGDDLIQWTVRYGCILHDPDAVMRTAYERIVHEGLWPDHLPKLERAGELARLAERVLAIEDGDAAQEHARAALTSVARALLLADGTFPLARAELSAQLRAAGYEELADWLARSIHEQLSLAELHDVLASVRRLDLARARA
jgi:hypothetical protein